MNLKILPFVVFVLGFCANSMAAERKINCLATDVTGHISDLSFGLESHTIMMKRSGSSSWLEIYGSTRSCGFVFGPTVSCTHEVEENLSDSSAPNKYFYDTVTCNRESGDTASFAKFSAYISQDSSGQFSCDISGNNRYFLKLSSCSLQ